MSVRVAGRGGDRAAAAGRDAVPDALLPDLSARRLRGRPAGGVRGHARDADRLRSDPELAGRYRAAHEAYLRRRAELGHVPEIDGISAGGMPTRVKCLHALLGHALAAGHGVNPLGDEVREALPPWWAAGPCVPAGESA